MFCVFVDGKKVSAYQNERQAAANAACLHTLNPLRDIWVEDDGGSTNGAFIADLMPWGMVSADEAIQAFNTVISLVQLGRYQSSKRVGS